MAFSGSQTTALQPFGAPGRVRSFLAKTATEAQTIINFFSADTVTFTTPREEATLVASLEQRTFYVGKELTTFGALGEGSKQA